MTSRLIAGLLLAGILFVAPVASTAAPIQSGELRIAGLNDAVVGQTFLNFLCAALFGTCPADYADFLRTGVTGDFAVPGTTSTAGFIHRLNQASAPINEAFLLNDFIVFNPAADARLDLTFIYTGVNPQAPCLAPAAPGQLCTPLLAALVTAANPGGFSPYNLQNTANGGSTVSFDVAGVTRRLSTGESALFRGTFAAGFGVPYQNYLPTLLAGGTIQSSYSAVFVAQSAIPQSAIPEPGTTALMLGGLALLAGGYIRRKRA